MANLLSVIATMEIGNSASGSLELSFTERLGLLLPVPALWTPVLHTAQELLIVVI